MVHRESIFSNSSGKHPQHLQQKPSFVGCFFQRFLEGYLLFFFLPKKQSKQTATAPTNRTMGRKNKKKHRSGPITGSHVRVFRGTWVRFSGRSFTTFKRKDLLWIFFLSIQESCNTPRYRTPQAIPRSPTMKGIPLQPVGKGLGVCSKGVLKQP